MESLAVDVDGTITEDGGVIDLDAAFTLRWMEKSGIRVLLVSGRSVWEVFSLAIYLGTTRVVVCENGGVIAFSPVDMLLLADKYQSLIAYDYLSKRIEGLRLKLVFPRFTEVVLERTFDINYAKRLLVEGGLPIDINDSKYAYHLTHKDVNKGRGLIIALKYLKIDPKSCIAIGDSETDISMFKVCGYSIALGNSPDSVKAEASYSVPSKYGKGLVEAVHYIVEKFLSP
ncbi:MAG: phosphoglycolate phosphatase [Nitrososphaerales archaeon]|nr:phosphoglycolate phosphatase [Nitrososphaerales archaeon]